MKSLQADKLNTARKRRLRKKLRVGEFQEFGVSLDIGLNQTSVTLDVALDIWIEFVESKGWAFGGGARQNGDLLSGFICQARRGTLHESDRAEVAQWLSQQHWVTHALVHDLHDAWHGHA